MAIARIAVVVMDVDAVGRVDVTTTAGAAPATALGPRPVSVLVTSHQ